jgi:2-polyprenyl-6-methoxyphenol hydroxylase-like FAD-dependent oxidoreductase
MSKGVESYDIVIVGAGPVGLMLSLCLSRWGWKIKHIDNRPLPTATGRADGIQPRTLEILKNLGLKRNIMKHEPAKVFEVAFWDPASAESMKIIRTGTWASCPPFIQARYPYTALLHQGFIERVLIEDIQLNGNLVDRPSTITRFTTNNDDEKYPVEVDFKSLDTNVTETVRTKYLFGGEGARSFVREQLGIKVTYKDPVSHVWGVMDGVVRTNFPDIKLKCTIHSNHGSIMVIPRENSIVRLYIQIASSSEKDFDSRQTKTPEEIQAIAKKILQPYFIIWEKVEWYSVYPIGQGIAEKYTLDQRVFIGGDACHTHSPKAGQGMNTAFHDAINLAWKLNLVESGVVSRAILETYETERKQIAETLLDFDNKYAALFSKRQPSANEVDQVQEEKSHKSTTDAQSEFIEMFKANCEFTSGFGVAYAPNVFNFSPTDSSLLHPLIITQEQNPRIRPGRIFPPSNATRVVDANRVHLEDQVPLDGSFRIFIFGGSNCSLQNGNPNILTSFAEAMQAPLSFYQLFSKTASRSRPHAKEYQESSLISLVLTLVARRADVQIETLPQLFQLHQDRIYADDIWDASVPNAIAAAHAKLGLGDEEKAEGAVVVVRPDGHVGIAIRLVGMQTVEVLEMYFKRFMAG